jgi:hypothetical protein
MIKKIFYPVFFLVVVSCSTSTNLLPTKELKVDSVKVSQVNIFDLGNKNGASVKANFSIGREKSPFGIKTETNADLVGTIDCVRVFLHGVNNGDPKPNLATRTSSTIKKDISVNTNSFNLTFSGLIPGKDYYVAAQAYSGGCNGVNETSSNGLASTTTGGGTAGALGILYLPSENSNNEEFISVSSLGVPNVENDNTNNAIDITIQLRKSTNASVTGKANIYNGDVADPENITSP